MKHLRNLLDGMAIMGEVLAAPAPYPDTTQGFARDYAALRHDVAKVNSDFNRHIQHAYGKQEYTN